MIGHLDDRHDDPSIAADDVPGSEVPLLNQGNRNGIEKPAEAEVPDEHRPHAFRQLVHRGEETFDLDASGPPGKIPFISFQEGAFARADRRGGTDPENIVLDNDIRRGDEEAFGYADFHRLRRIDREQAAPERTLPEAYIFRDAAERPKLVEHFVPCAVGIHDPDKANAFESAWESLRFLRVNPGLWLEKVGHAETQRRRDAETQRRGALTAKNAKNAKNAKTPARIEAKR